MKDKAACYVWWDKGDKKWLALCVDFDLMAYGDSYDEALGSLQDAIDTYVSYVRELPEPDRSRLLNRKSPTLLRLRLELKFLYYGIRGIFRLARADQSPRRTTLRDSIA